MYVYKLTVYLTVGPGPELSVDEVEGAGPGSDRLLLQLVLLPAHAQFHHLVPPRQGVDGRQTVGLDLPTRQFTLQVAQHGQHSIRSLPHSCISMVSTVSGP